MRPVITLLILAAMIYGIVDCAQSDARTRRNIPLWIWVALMILLPVVGTVIWLVVSRLIEPGPEVQQRRPVAPDDDPEFLRELERRTRKPQPEPGPAASSEASDEREAEGDAVEDEPGPNESR